MSDEHRESSFSSTDAVDVKEYPRVSRAAVIALLLGIVSASALASPVLWFLPLVGIVLALVAVRSITQAAEPVAGRRAAVIGLVLSLIFIAWAPSRYFVRNELLYRQAREHCEYFLGLVLEGRLHEAHQLTLKKDNRLAPNANLNQAYNDNQEMADSFEGFCGGSPMKEIIALERRGQVRFVGRRDVEAGRSLGASMDYVTEELAIDHDENGQTQTLPVLITIARTRNRGTGEVYWSIEEVEDPDTPRD